MDPNATLREIERLLQDDMSNGYSPDGIDDLVENLRNWLGMAGASPKWNTYPLATEYFNARMAMFRKFPKRYAESLSA